MADQHSSQADKLAQQMGFPNAATYLAWQDRQKAMESIPAQAMPRPAPAAPPPSHVQSFLNSIMQYLPLGSLQKAGNAMDGKK